MYQISKEEWEKVESMFASLSKQLRCAKENEKLSL